MSIFKGNDDNDIFDHPFHIVSTDFPISNDGIIGRDFLEKYEAKICFRKKIISFGYENINIIWNLILRKRKTIPA